MYVRDSGLVHALLGIGDYNTLAGHPVVGMSWEGFVIENLLSAAPPRTRAGFYRTSAGAEIDLVLELPGKAERWAVEIKHGLSTGSCKGFHNAVRDLQPTRTFIVHAGTDRYPAIESTEAIGVRDLAKLLSSA